MFALALGAPELAIASAAHNDSTETVTFEPIKAELHADELELFSAFQQTLTSHGRAELTKFTDHLQAGERGLFALLLMDLDPELANKFLALLGSLDDEQLGSLARQLRYRDDDQWNAIPDLLKFETVAQVREELFPDDDSYGCWETHEDQEIGASGFDPDRPAGVLDCSAAIMSFRDQYQRKPQRIVRGTVAGPNEANWQAQLTLHGPSTQAYRSPKFKAEQVKQFGRELYDWEINHACGAVYVGGRFLLTAAHCIGGASNAVFFAGRRIRLGTKRIDEDDAVFSIRTVTVHEDFNPDTYANDIALIELDGAPQQSSTLTAAMIPSSARGGGLRDGTRLLLSGWGYQGATYSAGAARDLAGDFQQRASRRLMRANIVLQSNNDCRDNRHFRKKKYQVRAGQLCAGSSRGVDSCRGDSGGPLVDTRTNTLVGLVSYGPGCGLSSTPGVYVDVGAYSDWIKRAKGRAISRRAKARYKLR